MFFSALEKEKPIRTIEQYIPSPEELRKLEVLKDLVSFFETQGVVYTITGGYGLDGLYGALTREHSDVDIMLGSETDRDMVHEMLTCSGFDFVEQKTSGTKLYLDKESGSILLEVKIWDDFAPHLTEDHRDPDIFFPEEPNAHLDGCLFRTPSVEGHEIYWEAQGRRAVEENWTDCETQEKADGRRALINLLKKRNSEKQAA